MAAMAGRWMPSWVVAGQMHDVQPQELDIAEALHPLLLVLDLGCGAVGETILATVLWGKAWSRMRLGTSAPAMLQRKGSLI